MQGDYMRLRYAVTQDVNPDSVPSRGFMIVKLRANGVAERLRIQSAVDPISAGEYAIKYTAGSWSINLGAESFFFLEGQADRYAVVKYGGLRADDRGESVLVGLYDERLKNIQ